MTKKKRIAILGGGMGSLVTAFELTRLPEHRARHEITVYQPGHRLGGKGASGVARDREGRIEEHGLHVMWGFYHNAFRVLRECYAELGRPADAPLARLEDALMPQHVISIHERDGDRLAPWLLFCPPNADRPGDERPLDDPGLYLERVLDWYAMLMGQMGRSPDAIAEDWPREIGDALALSEPGTIRALVRRLAEGGALPAAAATALVRRAIAILPRGDREGRLSILRLIDRLPRRLSGEAGAEARQLRVLADLAIAVVRGVVADELLLPEPRFFEADDEDLRDWLRRHGAREESVTSPLIAALYHAAFAGAQPIGAGTLVHAFLRMVTTYQGAVIYRFRAGMGDVVFAPLHEVLRRRGVRFRFFHRVRDLQLSADRRRVARVVIERQATVREGEYRPLIDVGGLSCWPREALLDQLVEGDAIRAGAHDLESAWTAWRGPETITLEDRRDFDEVVLGISLGALPEVARELVDDASNPAFRTMTERVRTIQTQAAQLWLDRDLAGLGWPRGNDRHLPIHIPFDAPFDTWSDMSYLLPLERWPAEHAPKHLAYLCSHLDDVEPIAPEDDTDYPARQRARVRENLAGWLRRSAGALWPGATIEGRFDFERLVDPRGREGEARLEAQHWCAVESASDRYVLSVPGSVRARLRAHESGYENLVLAGDWTKTAFSIGCLEAATMSGFAAARAIERECRRASGDWLPEAGPRRVAADDARLPAYVSSGQLLALPPLSMKTKLVMFLLDADLAKLQALVDRTLNLPGSPTRYRVVAPNVVLYCSSAETAPIDDPIGWCPEKDFGFWIPVVARGPEGREHHAVMTPWLWVDSGVAVIGGREVFGFPKELGRLAWPEDWKRPEELSIDTLVLPRTAPGERVVERRLATVRRAGGGALSRARTVANGTIRLARSLDAILEHGASGSYLGFTKAVLERRELRFAFLKQLPDVEDPTRACYRAITEAPIRIVDDLRFGLIDADYEVELFSFASHPIADALGLRARERTTERSVVPVVGSVWLEFHARVERGEVLFEESARRSPTTRERPLRAPAPPALRAD